MTNAPYLMPKARAGYRMGHQTVYDHMFLDGLEDAYDKGRLMGTFAEDCAATFAFTREAQDAFALASLSRALAANNDGTFAWEIAPVTVAGRKGDVVVDKDEQPAKAMPDKIPHAEAGVPQGRHGDRGELELDLRRRRGAGADAPLDRRAARARAARGDRRRTRRTRRSRGCSRRRRSARSRSCYRKTGWTTKRRRPVRDQRGVRRRDDGGDEGARPCRTTRSTCTAAPARSATRSAPRARASSSR